MRLRFLGQRILMVFATMAMATTMQAAIISQWTFEAPNGVTGNTGAASNAVNASTGTGTATGLHASAATVYSTPAGNGGGASFSSNTWAVGDYYQFSTATTGNDIGIVTFDVMGSSTGPANFTFQYRIGTSDPFTIFSSYNATAAYSTISADLTAITALSNQSVVQFRLVDVSTTSIGAGTVAAGGTSRVDNFTVNSPVPEPSSVALASLAGLGFLGYGFRRKRA